MTMPELSFASVSVQYPVYNSQTRSLRSQLARFVAGGRIEASADTIQLVTALQEVSFDLRTGDRVGVVGHNGAGKSTLLRTMAGVYEPSAGTVLRRGRVATVLELGAGLDGELSGYENITRMSRLLGRSAADVQAAIADIESFTRLGEFLKLPVRTYSSGMTTRLMFAIATSITPDILLLDEVFGAGDSEFQVQAQERMESLIASVGIFVFASHEHDKVKRYCDRFFRLDHGHLSEISADEF
jgi:ABC-type polysaccharide/polyol phosphate transport system ATPase subunit